MDIIIEIGFVFLIVCAIAASLAKNSLTSIVIFSAYSLIMCIIWMIIESPDLAITEAAVGAGVTTILFYVTLKKIDQIDVAAGFEKKINEVAKGERVTGKQSRTGKGSVNVRNGRKGQNGSGRNSGKRRNINGQGIKKVPGKVASSGIFRGSTEHKLQIAYRTLAILMVVLLFVFMLLTVIGLPNIGINNGPESNEVVTRYIESGLEETGAVNIVSGMILDYRAFDTFGESCVLFVATICVTLMLRIDRLEDECDKEGPTDDSEHLIFEPKADNILKKGAMIVVPIILVYGIYVILNGHLSPGGGFSGGSVLGAGFILFSNAFGFEQTEKFLNAKSVKWITFCSLLVYCLAKSYSFFTGANGLESGIPLGTPGAILSSGLILILNICVGFVVACTMYSFYSLVRRGKI